MNQRKQILAVVAGPYRFYQTLWLYTQFPEYEWSILLLPYGNSDKMENQLQEICQNLNIFKKIYRSKMVGQNSGLAEQAKMFLKMLFFYVVGKREYFMETILNSQIGDDGFDIIFIGCEYSIIEGAVIGLAKRRDVYILEEGLGDYLPRKKNPSFSYKEIMSYIVSKMGYFSPYAYFELENLKHCTKYASLPLLMTNRKYKAVKELFVKNEVTDEQFSKLSEKAFKVNKNALKQCDVILFTSTFNRSVEENKDCVEKMHQWLKKNFSGKKILIKKHPRDEETYSWDDLDCDIYKEDIPAELFIELIDKHEIVMMSMTTILISLLQTMKKIYILQFDDIHGRYEEHIKQVAGILKIDESKIIHL